MNAVSYSFKCRIGYDKCMCRNLYMRAQLIMTACRECSIRTRVSPSLRLIFYVPPHASVLLSVCSVIAFYSLASPPIWGVYICNVGTYVGTSADAYMWVHLYVCR